MLAGLVYALSVALRLVFLTQGIRDPVLQIPFADDRINWGLAQVILDGVTRPTCYVRAPGYLYWLAWLSGLSGQLSFNARMLQVFIDAFGPVLMLLIGARLFGPLAGVVAGLLGAVYWTFVFFSCQLLDASLTCLLCLLLGYLLLRLPDDRWWKWLVCGLVTGVACIVRPNLLAFPLLLGVILILRGLLTWRQSRLADGRRGSGGRAVIQALVRGGLVIVGCLLSVAPVTIRNRVVGGDWVLVCVSGGGNFWMANHPEADGKDPSMIVDDRDAGPAVDPMSDDPWEWDLNVQVGIRYGKTMLGEHATHSEIDRMFIGMALDNIAAHPGNFARNLLKRFCWLFNVYEFPNNNDQYEFLRFSSLLRVLSKLHYGVLCPLALLGLGLVAGRARCRDLGLVCYLTLVATIGSTLLLFVINARYRLPVVALLTPFAGCAVVGLAQLVYQVRSRRAPLVVSLAALIVVAVFCNANPFGYRPARRPLHLDSLFAWACDLCGEKELLPEAMETFGRELIADAESPGKRQSLATVLRRYAHPFAYLMDYYRRTGDWGQMVKYGRYMLAFEPRDEHIMRSFFYVALVSGRPEVARDALDAVAPYLARENPGLLGICHMQMAKNFRDRQAALTAVAIFGGLVEARPGDAKCREFLSRAEKLALALAEARRGTTSAAATTSRSSGGGGD